MRSFFYLEYEIFLFIHEVYALNYVLKCVISDSKLDTMSVIWFELIGPGKSYDFWIKIQIIWSHTIQWKQKPKFGFALATV